MDFAGLPLMAMMSRVTWPMTQTSNMAPILLRAGAASRGLAGAGGCGGDIGGTWESASGRTTLDLDAASGSGALESRQGRYRTVTPFTWSATADSITVAYTRPTQFYEIGTGKNVDFEKDSKGGTVHCAFAADTLTVGGVAYRRQ